MPEIIKSAVSGNPISDKQVGLIFGFGQGLEKYELVWSLSHDLSLFIEVKPLAQHNKQA